jgi:hypothetical protein
VWTYPGASSLGSESRRGLKDHPTVKPTAMLEDALVDLTKALWAFDTPTASATC